MKESLENQLDEEWVKLVIMAKKIGLTLEDVRTFINEYDNQSIDK